MKCNVQSSPIHGRGVFATQDLQPGDIIEECHLILFTKDDTKTIDQTNLFNYYFADENGQSAIALGNGSLYNHSYSPNAQYHKDFTNDTLTFIARKPIKKNEEITVNYNEDPDDRSPVWFER